jgi:hypothetical protein
LGKQKGKHMKTITTDQIENRLKESFLDVKPLSPIEAFNIEKAEYQQVTSNIPFEGITLICGIYSDRFKKEFNRFVICAMPNPRENRIFLF